MAREFAGDTGGAVAGRQVVDGAYVVETTTGNKVAAGGVGTGHDPGRAEGNRVHLVGGVGVPDDELSILRGRDEVSPVGGPVHGVDLCEMALEVLADLHIGTRQGLQRFLCDLSHCRVEMSSAAGIDDGDEARGM